MAGSEVTGFGTVRARLGYAWDRTLIYATGGWAYGRARNSISDIRLCGVVGGGTGCVWGDGASRSLNYSSGWTLGAGLEYAFTNNLSAKIEYLYVDLGSKSLASVDSKKLLRKIGTSRSRQPLPCGACWHQLSLLDRCRWSRRCAILSLQRLLTLEARQERRASLFSRVSPQACAQSPARHFASGGARDFVDHLQPAEPEVRHFARSRFCEPGVYARKRQVALRLCDQPTFFDSIGAAHA